ncbi:hypothetical protein ABZ605_27830 [Streptomyces sp. NPDC012765]|uniref:hypothetical protein n=1 Tax=Streptomyces sp. NPDC012765 TaxID=3155249 RepID=UPI00340B75DF
MADRPTPYPLPDNPGSPSRELRVRAADGLTAFLARWEDPAPAAGDQGGAAESEER